MKKVLFLVLSLLVMGGCSLKRNTLTTDDVNEIKIGMTNKEVNDVLNEPVKVITNNDTISSELEKAHLRMSISPTLIGLPDFKEGDTSLPNWEDQYNNAVQASNLKINQYNYQYDEDTIESLLVWIDDSDAVVYVSKRSLLE